MKEEKKTKVNIKDIMRRCIVIVIVVAISGIIGTAKGYINARNDSPAILSDVSVTNFVESEKLNTFRTNYEDVVTVFDEKKTDKVDYYVSYEAIVDVGVNFSDIDIEQNDKEKTITIFVPKAAIQDINIDITSLDFLFYDKKQNNEDILNDAYKICNKDAEEKLGKKEKIIELANENVQNLISAYLQPFMEVTNNEYSINYIIGEQNENK